MSKNPTGLCSAHQHGEDKNCKTCYPAQAIDLQTHVRHDFEDLDEQLNKVKCIDDLLEVIFDDYLTTYYQNPPLGRKEFLEKLMDKIHEYRA